MLAYTIRRMMGSLIVLIGISIITFLLVFAVPSDPARAIAGPKASLDTIIAIRHALGLDQPLYMQYFHYLGRLIHGNLGESYQYNMPVTELIGQRYGATAMLAIGSWIAELLIGIPLGIYTARHARRLGDYIVSIFVLVTISMPVYWLGLILLYYFGYKIPIFPLGGPGGLYHLILPSLTVGLTGAGYYARILKSSMLEVLNQDYVRTARAKGAGNRRVIWRHVLRNAMIPVVTYGGIDIGYLLGGLLLTETTFNWNGVGILAYTAIQEIDLPVIMATVLMAAVLTVVFNLFVDLLYAVIDPRIRYS